MKVTFKRIAKLVLGAALVVLSSLALHDGYRMHQGNVRFVNEGYLTSATVRHLSPNPQDSNYPFIAHVEFRITDGQLVAARIPVFNNEAQLARTEQSLPIQYLRANPKTARIYRSKGGLYLALAVGLTSLFVGVFLLWPRRVAPLQSVGSGPTPVSDIAKETTMVATEVISQNIAAAKPALSTNAADTTGQDNAQPFVSPGFGILLLAYPGWQENSDERYFQVIDPATGTQFTASGYENPGIGLDQWAEARLSMLAEGMPYMKRLCPPYPVSGNGWQGIATECRGTFPDDDKESHYLVLCLLSGQRVVSFTITASVEVFRANEALYRDILKSRLLLASAVEK